MSTFLAIGLGPIQTGIFLSGAAKGNFSRIVVAEVDDNIRESVSSSGGNITINIATRDSVFTETVSNVEIYNPLESAGKNALIDAAAEAEEIATALPSINFFAQIADYLCAGFKRTPDKFRIIYTAENHNHAAENLRKALEKASGNVDGLFPNTHCLNTVIGKMSSVVPKEDCELRNLALLCENADRGHLVEEFNNILISSAPSIEKRGVKNLTVKENLLPFEEAKLYGHNAIHFLLAVFGEKMGKKFMPELADCTELLDFAKSAFTNECGKALCRKWSGIDKLFTEKGFAEYAGDLLIRMLNPYLRDSIPRITRDLPRKLGWDDRIIGTMRLVCSQDIKPLKLASCAHIAAVSLFGEKPDDIKKGLKELWPAPWETEHDLIYNFIEFANSADTLCKQ